MPMTSHVVSTAVAIGVVALIPTLPVAAGDPASVFRDGLEPACPSSWSAASGWSCIDGSAPLTGNALVEEPGDPGCPAGMILIEDFCIDRYGASLALVGAGGALSPWSPYVSPTSETVRALSVAYATPQGYVSQIVATSACAESGKRLCTDAEWLRACRGPSMWTYPWGDTAVSGAPARTSSVVARGQTGGSRGAGQLTGERRASSLDDRAYGPHAEVSPDSKPSPKTGPTSTRMMADS